MTDTLYRIRHTGTGLWWGKKRQYEKGPWRKRPERFLAKSALVLCLKSIDKRELPSCEVVVYRITPVDQVPLPPSAFLKEKP